MATDYQRKYVECIKIYHKLHAEMAGLTMKLISRLRDMDIPTQYKSSLNEVISDEADAIRKVDFEFRDLVRANWKPSDVIEENNDEENEVPI